MSGSEDEQTFVKVVEGDNIDDFVELPAEDDDTILLSTLQGQFPNAVGLRYKSKSGGWRGVRISGDKLDPPSGGWGDIFFYITIGKDSAAKRKAEDTPTPTIEKTELTKKIKTDYTNEDNVNNERQSEEREESHHQVRPADKKYLGDLIVLSLPYTCKDSDLKEYFTSACGEMNLHEVKYDRQTKKSRGFGFIRFKTVEGAKAALNGEHSILGRTIEIKLSKKKEDPMKLFVGRIPHGTTHDSLKSYFEEFGEVKELYLPNPFRAFGFITFMYSQDARAVLRRTHRFKGQVLNLQPAEPKEEKIEHRRREEEDRFGPNQDRGNDFGGDDYQMNMRNQRGGWGEQRDGLRDGLGNGARDMPRDMSRDMPRDGLRDMQRDGSRDMPRDVPRDGPRDGQRFNDFNGRGPVQPEFNNQFDPRDPASELKNMLFSLLNAGGVGR